MSAAPGERDAGRRLVDEALRLVEALRATGDAGVRDPGGPDPGFGESAVGESAVGEPGDEEPGVGPDGADGAGGTASGCAPGFPPGFTSGFASPGFPASGFGPGHTGPECRLCPVCRLVAVVRTLRPEVVEHLALAAADLVSAWREVVSGAAPEGASPAPPRREPSVEHIDVTD